MPWVGLLSDKTKHSMRGLGRRTVMGGGVQARVLRSLRFSAGPRERPGANANCDGILDSQLGRAVLYSGSVSLGFSLPFCSASQ